VHIIIDNVQYPVHRDFMEMDYDSFASLAEDAKTVTASNVTRQGLDVILSLQYNGLEWRKLSLQEVADGIIAWDAFGGSADSGKTLRDHLATALSPHAFSELTNADKLADVLCHYPFFDDCRVKLQAFAKAATPEAKARLEACVDLQSRRQRKPPSPEDMTVKDLRFELVMGGPPGANRMTKGELIKAVEKKRADVALEQLLEACEASTEMRKEMFEDMVATHQDVDENYNVMFADGSIYFTKLGGCLTRLHEPSVPGPSHIARHLFWDVADGEPLPGFHEVAPCIRCVDLQPLVNLRERLAAFFPALP
jgi:hypothetical protein